MLKIKNTSITDRAEQLVVERAHQEGATIEFEAREKPYTGCFGLRLTRGESAKVRPWDWDHFVYRVREE